MRKMLLAMVTDIRVVLIKLAMQVSTAFGSLSPASSTTTSPTRKATAIKVCTPSSSVPKTKVWKCKSAPSICTNSTNSVAAHWRYKEGGRRRLRAKNRLVAPTFGLARKYGGKLAAAFKTELFNDTIYVLTPHGKVLSLPTGATPIDFAYALHSSIGDRCRGSKVEGQIVPLSTPLENGQRVEIITAKEGHPSVNWLYEGWVKSNKAIGKIRAYIRQQNADTVREEGRVQLDKRRLQKARRPLHRRRTRRNFQPRHPKSLRHAERTAARTRQRNHHRQTVQNQKRRQKRRAHRRRRRSDDHACQMLQTRAARRHCRLRPAFPGAVGRPPKPVCGSRSKSNRSTPPARQKQNSTISTLKV
ncbi:TGS domain protein [Neisseria meningitidis 2005040]|nr:TGS domain protein [Neisseria meningitidis 2005040]